MQGKLSKAFEGVYDLQLVVNGTVEAIEHAIEDMSKDLEKKKREMPDLGQSGIGGRRS